jgi:RHS repeat-associated protein
LRTVSTLTGATLYSFAYDSAGRLASVTDGYGNTTSIQRDGNGNATAIIGPFGQVTTLTLDANGFLSSVTDAANDSYQFTYTADGLMTTSKTPRGSVTSFSYDGLGRLAREDDAAGGFRTFARIDQFPGSSFTVTRKTALGVTTQFQETDSATGDLMHVTTLPEGLQRLLTEGANGVSNQTQPTGSAQSLTLGPDPRFGLQSAINASWIVKSPGGVQSTNSTQRIVQLANVNDPLSLVSQTDTLTTNGRTFSSVYTASTKSFLATSPAGRVMNTTIDSQGRTIAAQFANLAPTAIQYDSHGRPTSITEGVASDARTTSFSYNPQGYIASITDPLNRVTSFTYDAAGRVTSRTLPDGRIIATSYDTDSNETSIAPPSRGAHVFNYSPLDLPSLYNPPDVSGVSPDETSTTYDLDGDVGVVARPDGKALSYTYDAAGRLASVAFSRGSVGFAYSTTGGQVSGMTAPGGVAHAFAYDGDLLVSHALTGPVSGTIAWSFNNDLLIASEAVNGDAVTFAYDPDALLVQAGAIAITRDAANGLVTGATLGNSADTYAYNSHREVVDHHATYNSSDVYREQFVRDAIGRIVQKTETITGATDNYMYSYDAVGRLVGVSKNGASTGVYTYDANSNRTSYSGVFGNVQAGQVVVDAQDRLTQYGSTTYTYDNNGETVSKATGGQTTQYSYDELGNLTRVVLPDGTTIDYLIDALNRRIGKKVNGTLVKGWLWDGPLRIAAELDGSGNLVSRFIYGTRANIPEYMVHGGTTYRIVVDELGSPRLVIDVATGTVAERMNHDEFGQVTQDTSPGFVPFGFAGGLYDPQTQLVRFGERDYDPSTGRWLARDPILFAGRQVNLYTYAFNDPVDLNDPEGTEGGEGGIDDPLGVIDAPMTAVGKALSPDDPNGQKAIETGGGIIIGGGARRYIADESKKLIKKKAYDEGKKALPAPVQKICTQAEQALKQLKYDLFVRTANQLSEVENIRKRQDADWRDEQRKRDAWWNSLTNELNQRVSNAFNK